MPYSERKTGSGPPPRVRRARMIAAGVGHPLVRVLVAQQVFPNHGAGVAQAADPDLRLAPGVRGEAGGVWRRAGRQPAVAPGAIGIGVLREGRGGALREGARLDRRDEAGGVAAVIAVAVADRKVDMVAGLQPQAHGVGGGVSRALHVDGGIKDGNAVVEEVDIGGRAPRDAGEGRGQLVLAFCRGGPAEDAVLALRAGVEGELPRRPGDAEAADGPAGAVPGDVGIGLLAGAPEADPCRRAPGAAIETAAVEKRNASVIKRADQGEHGDGVAEDGPIGRLVEEAPHRHARVVAVAADHAAHRGVEPLRHLRRVAEEPAGVAFLVNQKADLIAKVQLIALGDAGDEAEGVESHDLGVEEVAAEEIRIVRQLEADGAAVAGVRAAEEDPPAVEAKGPILEAEVAEAAARRELVRAGRIPGGDPGRDPVEERIVEVPEARPSDLELSLEPRLPGRQIAIEPRRRQGFAAGRGRRGELYPATRRLRQVVAQAGADPDPPRLPVGADEEVLHPNRRGENQLHRVDEASLVPGVAGAVRQGLVAVRRLVEDDAVDGLVRGVEDADGQAVEAAGLHRRGDIEDERRLPPFMAAGGGAVEPHLGLVIRRPEAEQVPPLDALMARRLEIAPVPGDAVVAGEDVLNDPGNLGALRLRPGGFEPLLPAPGVLRIRRQEPILPIQRDHRRGGTGGRH